MIYKSIEWELLEHVQNEQLIACICLNGTHGALNEQPKLVGFIARTQSA